MTPLRGYCNFHVKVRPATLETAAAIAAGIVGLKPDDVIARRTELRGCRCLSILRGNRRAGVFEHHRARSPELAPGHVCRRTLTRARFGRYFPVVGYPYCHCKRLVDFGVHG